MTTPPIDISAEEWRIVRDILRKHVPVHEIRAFGSRAKRNAKPYSDLDLAVITATPLSWEVSGALPEDFLESDLPFRVDVLDWARTSEAFRRVVEQAKVVVQTTQESGLIQDRPAATL
jgi:type I restriction enzyme S subunit